VIRPFVARTLRRAGRLVGGPPEKPLISRLIEGDRRWPTFLNAVDYVNYEQVPGDILEMGVFSGLSLALFAKAHSFDDKGMRRRIAGFDSFAGLPESAEEHARWKEGDCATNHSWHPLLAPGAAVTPETTRELFRACELPPPELEVGRFEATLPATVPAKYSQVALVHVDCDLYESTATVLSALAPAFQDGTAILFDDWFHYRGNPEKGEARAFHEFLAAHPEWGAVPYRSYATFCNSFLLYRK